MDVRKITAFVEHDDGTILRIETTSPITKAAFVSVDENPDLDYTPGHLPLYRGFTDPLNAQRFALEITIKRTENPCYVLSVNPVLPLPFADLLKRQRSWSNKTFGTGLRTPENRSHIEEELDEIRDAPMDLEERADLVLLALDGLLRCADANGLSSENAADAVVRKLGVNERRKWPSLSEQIPGKHVKAIKETPHARTEPTG